MECFYKQALRIGVPKKHVGKFLTKGTVKDAFWLLQLCAWENHILKKKTLKMGKVLGEQITGLALN